MSYTLRATPEDFRVDEIPLYPPAGHGDHTFVLVSKRLRTTEEVAADLARAAGVAARDVGYAGRKDRRAVATQWLSVPGLDPARARDLMLAGASVLDAVRHPHKLRTGHLRGNRFELVVRGVDAALWERGRLRLDDCLARGFPNRFGEQRFGSDGGNARRAVELFAHGAPRGRRREARFLVSALQALAFNACLDARELPVHRLEQGDVAVRHDSGGLFPVEDVARESARAEAFEISATGPIFGTRMPRPAGAVLARELRVLAEHGVDLGRLRAPAGVSLRGGRRPLRARPGDAGHALAGDALRLWFALPAGSYATVFVEALLGAPAAAPSHDTDADRAVC
jgi:tRNA pseudouridine13 synthase